MGAHWFYGCIVACLQLEGSPVTGPLVSWADQASLSWGLHLVEAHRLPHTVRSVQALLKSLFLHVLMEIRLSHMLTRAL